MRKREKRAEKKNKKKTNQLERLERFIRKYSKAVLLTRHHIIPRSRGGTDSKDNILKKSYLEHNAWHYLFYNMKPEEAIQMIIKQWTDEFGKLREWRLGEAKLLAWRIVFGNAMPAEAIAIINRDWFRPHPLT